MNGLLLDFDFKGHHLNGVLFADSDLSISEIKDIEHQLSLTLTGSALTAPTAPEQIIGSEQDITFDLESGLL